MEEQLAILLRYFDEGKVEKKDQSDAITSTAWMLKI